MFGTAVEELAPLLALVPTPALCVVDALLVAGVFFTGGCSAEGI